MNGHVRWTKTYPYKEKSDLTAANKHAERHRRWNRRIALWLWRGLRPRPRLW